MISMWFRNLIDEIVSCHGCIHLFTCGLFLGTLSMLDCNIFPGLGQDYLAAEVNMFLLPVQENDGEDSLTKAG